MASEEVAVPQASQTAMSKFFANIKKKPTVKPKVKAKEDRQSSVSESAVDEYGYLKEEETQEQKETREKAWKNTQRIVRIKKHIYAIWRNIYEEGGENYQEALRRIDTYINSSDAERDKMYSHWVDKSFPIPDDVVILLEKSSNHYIIKARQRGNEITHLTLPKDLKQNISNDLAIHFTTNPGNQKEFYNVGDFSLLEVRGGRIKRAKVRTYRKRVGRLLTRRVRSSFD